MEGKGRGRNNVAQPRKFRLSWSHGPTAPDHPLIPTLERSAAESSLRLLDTKVRDMCNDLLPGFITQMFAPSMKEELKEIANVKDEFRQAVRSHLIQFVE